MREKTQKKSTPLSEDVLQQMAIELNRLSSNIYKDIKNKSILKVLSNLTAITPLQETLMSQLSNALFETEEQEQSAENKDIPGYL
jgi:hypothetical protein